MPLEGTNLFPLGHEHERWAAASLLLKEVAKSCVFTVTDPDPRRSQHDGELGCGFAATKQSAPSSVKETRATLRRGQQRLFFILMPFWDPSQKSWVIISTALLEQEEAEILRQSLDLWAALGKLKPKVRCSINGNRWGSRGRPRLLPTTTSAPRTTLVREVGGCPVTSSTAYR